MLKRITGLIIIAALCFQALLVGKDHGYQIVPSELSTPILTPSLAQRETLKLRLENGLEAFLISDPEASQAGAVLKVQAGSWDDPKEYPGLAHFLEHMLFLGTEKYPIESDYDRFIHAHDGEMNAYTTTDYTLFLFSISASAFDEALDRFSNFFKKPLFNPTGIERELHSIDQEFEKNYYQNGSRELQVRKELANPEHPFHHFSTGNIKSLEKATQKDLKEWYQQHYSADEMRLIVYGPYSIDALKKWALKDFSDIPSSGLPPFHTEEPILNKNMEGSLVYVEPIQNTRTLRLTWEIPSSLVSPDSLTPVNLITSVLGDEGPGSLLSLLKAEGLAHQIGFSKDRLAKDKLLFSMNINLTKEGLDKISTVIERCFQVIQTLEKQNLPPYLFDEFKQIQTLRYQFQSRENVFNYLMSMGESFAYENLATFPEGAIIPQNYNQKAFGDFLHCLTPLNTHFTVITHQAPEFYDRKEKWMEVPYKVIPISQDQLQAWKETTPLDQYKLPAPNPFMPKNFELVNPSNLINKSKNIVPHPTLLVDDLKTKVYYAQDDRFFVPQTQWFFEIKSPLITSTDPQKIVLAELYIKTLQESLQNLNYLAENADLSYQISRTDNGILLSLTGFQDNTEALFLAILEHLKMSHPSATIFQNAKNSLFGKYGSINQENPLKQGFKIYQDDILESCPNADQLSNTLENTSYEMFLQYIGHLYDSTYIEGLLYGNVAKEKALQIVQQLQKTINSQSAFLPKNWPVAEILDLPAQGPYALELNASGSSHAAILAIEECFFSYKTRAAQEILSQAMSSAFYSTLRTKQQTGYLINSSTNEIGDHFFTFFAVQSATHDPRDLLARFELFIETFLDDMEQGELTKENFESIREALILDLENSPQNLVDTGYLLKNLAFKYEGDFDRMAKRIEGFKELTYEEFLGIATEFLGKQNKRRVAILMKGKSDKDFHYETISSPQEMRRLSQLHSF